MTFYADNTNDWFIFLFGLFGLALGFGMAYALLKGWIGGPDAKRRNLGAMLSFFLGLLGLGLALFTGWFLYRMQPVTIGEETLETGWGTFELSQVRDAQIVTDTRRSFADPDITLGSDRFLLIEIGSEKTIALPDKKYDLEGILRALRAAKAAEESARD
jgi:hypothetical protein